MRHLMGQIFYTQVPDECLTSNNQGLPPRNLLITSLKSTLRRWGEVMGVGVERVVDVLKAGHERLFHSENQVGTS